MMQARFKSLQHFKQYKAEWRKAYKSIALQIREHKAAIKSAGREHCKEAQTKLENLRIVARSLMIAMDGARAQYAVDKLNSLNEEFIQAKAYMTRLHAKIDPENTYSHTAKKRRRLYDKIDNKKPSDEEIARRRQMHPRHQKEVEQQSAEQLQTN